MSAKKCRFCRRWLPQESGLQKEDTPRGLLKEPPQMVEVDAIGENNYPCTEIPPAQRSVQPNPTPTVITNETPNQGLQQNIVIQPQIIVENKQEVHQEQNVEVRVGHLERASPGGCLWTQLVVLSIGLCFVFKGFWYGVAAFIFLAIALYIPVLGQALCVVLGLAFGLIAGSLSASFGAPTWIAWLIGIVSTVGLIYANLEQRKAEV